MNTKNHLFLKVLYQIILPFLLFLGLLAIGKPLREWLDAQLFTLVRARMVASIIIRPIMLVAHPQFRVSNNSQGRNQG